MSPRLMKEIQVRVDRRGMPRGFFHDGRFWIVREVVDVWRDTGEWWEGEEEKIFFRIGALPVREDGPPVLCEIYTDRRADVWVLYVVYD